MKASRRSFLSVAIGAVALPGSLPAHSVAVSHDSSFDPWVEVHRDNLLSNVREIGKRVSARPVLAVIKNNGYGLGLVNVARMLEPLSAIEGFAVVKFQEAIALRDAGIKKPVLLMGPFGESEMREAVVRRIMPMVYTPVGALLDRAGRSRGLAVPIHVCIDTGIGRVGVPHSEAAALIRQLTSYKSIRIKGTMMTFSEDAEFDKEQLRRFQLLHRALEEEGIALGRKHAASSFALFQRPDSFLDMVRPGMAMYGIYSEQEFRRAAVMDLKPAVSLKARVAYVKRLRKGESAGYNRVYIAKKDDVWIATLPVGHSDGLPRVAVKGARVRINGNLYPLIASVSASHSIVEIGPEPLVMIGDVATIFDWLDGSRPEDFAASCGASVYDLTMHLNPLLPRRVIV